MYVVAVVVIAASAAGARTGTITGSLVQGPPGTSATAIDRATGKRHPGRIDAGRIVIEALALDASYDLIIDAPDRRLEGVDLSVPRSDYEEEQPLTQEDRTTLTDLVRSLNKFEDEVEVLAIAGNIQHAAVLVNKLRTRPFVNSKPGEVVWRAEIWRFERPDETWIKVQDSLFTVLYRERLPQTDFASKSITFDTALGGLRPTANKPRVDVGRVALPAAKPGIRLRPSS
jgi:hypothetical protein